MLSGLQLAPKLGTRTDNMQGCQPQPFLLGRKSFEYLLLAMLYNTSSSRYRSFNRIYPSKTARKYRYRNTFQRYSDTTVPHFTFFHQHPLCQKSQTSANTVVPLLPALLLVYPDISTRIPPGVPTPSPKPRTPDTCSQLPTPVLAPDFQLPAPHTQLTSKRLRVQVPDSRLPILEFPGLPAAQILHKIPDITQYRNFVCVS